MASWVVIQTEDMSNAKFKKLHAEFNNILGVQKDNWHVFAEIRAVDLTVDIVRKLHELNVYTYYMTVVHDGKSSDVRYGESMVF